MQLQIVFDPSKTSRNYLSTINAQQGDPMDKTGQVSAIKLKAYILVGAVGVIIILMADFAIRVFHKGVEGIKMIGWF